MFHLYVMKNILLFLLTWFIFLQFLDILKISLPTVFFLCRMRFWKILLFVFLSRHFLGILPLIFCKFWHGGRNPYEVVQDSAIFKKFFFDLKLGKSFYGENLYSLCVPVQIPYLAKYLFQRYGPKCSQPIRLQYFIINHISRRSE